MVFTKKIWKSLDNISPDILMTTLTRNFPVNIIEIFQETKLKKEINMVFMKCDVWTYNVQQKAKRQLSSTFTKSSVLCYTSKKWLTILKGYQRLVDKNPSSISIFNDQMMEYQTIYRNFAPTVLWDLFATSTSVWTNNFFEYFKYHIFRIIFHVDENDRRSLIIKCIITLVGFSL